MKSTYPRVPFSLIVKASDGDIEAINRIVNHYKGYISKRSLRHMTDDTEKTNWVVDEILQGRMKTKLITKILAFEIEQ